MIKAIVLSLLITFSLCSAGPQYTLSLEYALREGFSAQTSKGEIWWNGHLVLSLSSTDYEIKLASVNVYANDGENILQLRGAGISDSFGMTVDNIKLVKEGTIRNLVVNGGFENPKIENDWKGFHQGIQGWSAAFMEIGVGSFFNSRWPSQVCELDGAGNSIITQKIYVREMFTLSLDFAARENSPFETSQGEVWWNYEKVLSLQPNSYDLKTLSTHQQFIITYFKKYNQLYPFRKQNKGFLNIIIFALSSFVFLKKIKDFLIVRIQSTLQLNATQSLLIFHLLFLWDITKICFWIYLNNNNISYSQYSMIFRVVSHHLEYISIELFQFTTDFAVGFAQKR